MNKRTYLIVVVSMMMFIFVTGCAPERDLSTPSSAMVGQWGYYGLGRSEPVMEVYFEEFDDQGIGSCCIDTTIFICTILEEGEDSVRIVVTDEDGAQVHSNTWYPIDDGQKLTRDREQEFGYIDSKTEP